MLNDAHDSSRYGVQVLVRFTLVHKSFSCAGQGKFKVHYLRSLDLVTLLVHFCCKLHTNAVRASGMVALRLATSITGSEQPLFLGLSSQRCCVQQIGSDNASAGHRSSLQQGPKFQLRMLLFPVNIA